MHTSVCASARAIMSGGQGLNVRNDCDLQLSHNFDLKKIKNLCKGKQKTWPLFAMQCHERWSVSIAAEIISLVTSRADNEGLKTSFVDKQCQD